MELVDNEQEMGQTTPPLTESDDEKDSDTDSIPDLTNERGVRFHLKKKSKRISLFGANRCGPYSNPLHHHLQPANEILDFYKLKAFADDSVNMSGNCYFFFADVLSLLILDHSSFACKTRLSVNYFF